MKKAKATKTRALPPVISDPYLAPYIGQIEHRQVRAKQLELKLTGGKMPLADFASGHEYFGLHYRDGEWIFREWAPNATAVFMIGDFTGWKINERFALRRLDARGTWELRLPGNSMKHGDLYKLRMRWSGGEGDRLPAYCRRAVQDNQTLIFSAQVWRPDKPYRWKCPDFKYSFAAPLLYETHVGMAQERQGVGTYNEFREHTLPRILDAGYNTIQLMAVMEHPYYGSFGYHVSNFFAASSRFGTPEEFKALVDAAHEAGIAVIMDLVHSHAANNEIEGLSRFDGTLYQYFHDGDKGRHLAWDSRCFDYGKPEVLHFLLSNCRFWLDEYHVDGFRFDGITSMVYFHHGLGPAFDHYDRYFDSSVDEDALSYLVLANKVIHTVRPDAITIAEDVSGMPGLAAPQHKGGVGFDFRLAMGTPDCWFRLLRKVRDDDWNMDHLWRELTNKRQDEKTLSYVESHDQAIVGDKTAIFEMIDAAMYHFMRVSDNNLLIDRGMALHKMMRMVTLALAGNGYMNFMGNEFGHPEWIDFPRQGNNWSYHYARRQWHLRDDPGLKYHFLADFDKAMIKLIRNYAVIETSPPRYLYINDHDKIIAFERSGLYFVFNFHPTQSFADYRILWPPGEYHLIMDSDETAFGGHKRLAGDQHFFTQPVLESNVQKDYLKLYIPCRMAMVLRKV